MLEPCRESGGSRPIVGQARERDRPSGIYIADSSTFDRASAPARDTLSFLFSCPGNLILRHVAHSRASQRHTPGMGRWHSLLDHYSPVLAEITLPAIACQGPTRATALLPVRIPDLYEKSHLQTTW